jgi:hypothetical protein
VVTWGLALQLVFALVILRTPVGAGVFSAVNDVMVALLGFTVEGARFVFGDLVWNNVPVGTGGPGNGAFSASDGVVARTGGFFAFNVLPTIIFFSSLMTVLYHLGIMQRLVAAIAWVMQRTMGTSGAETLSAAGNIFVGHFTRLIDENILAYQELQLFQGVSGMILIWLTHHGILAQDKHSPNRTIIGPIHHLCCRQPGLRIQTHAPMLLKISLHCGIIYALIGCKNVGQAAAV